MKSFTKLLLSLVFLLSVNPGWGQINITTTTGSHSENFNSLISSSNTTWTDNSTIANWYAQRTGSGTNIVADDGSNNAGNLYSYGTGTDRALGSLGSNTIGNLAWGVKLRNTTTSTLQVSLAYTGEQWRNSAAAAQTVSFYYKKNVTDFSALNPNNNASWTNVASLNFTSPITGGTAGPLDGNNAANKVIFSATTVTTLAPNEYIILKWDDPNHPGNDHGLSIDDVTISWNLASAGSEINLQGNSVDIPDGGAGTPAVGNDTDFGNAEVAGGFVDKVFTIQNIGSANLTVGTITFGGAHAADFSVVSAPAATVAPGGSTTFTVRFDPSALGVRNATISIVNNDSDENPYNFNLQGTGTNSNQSDVIVTPSFVYPTNIPYINYQATDITPANIGTSSIEIAQFTIRDGGASSPDNDALPTILNNIQFSVLTCGAIRRLAIYDGTTEVQEITPTCAFASFSGLSLTAPDNGTKVFRVIASFVASPITNGSQIRLTVNSTSIGAGSSLFATTNAGGAQTSIAGDNNRLNVIATALAFGQNTSNTAVSSNMSPSPTVQAVDANGNLDTDFTGVISITSTGTMDASPKTATAVAGVATFANIVHTVAGTGLTLNATATGLSAATSNAFNIITSTIFRPGDLVFVGYDAQIHGCGLGDRVYFMTMVDILPGTSFIYANSRFEAGAAACTRTLRWGGSGNNPNEDPGFIIFTYNGPGNITAGSIIYFGSGKDCMIVF